MTSPSESEVCHGARRSQGETSHGYNKPLNSPGVGENSSVDGSLPGSGCRSNRIFSGSFFSDIAFFRAVNGFMFQFGIHGDPAISDKWAEANIKDDPSVGVSNGPGTICFAKTGLPNSRSTQMFINLGNNSFLDDQGFTPFGKVTEGLDVVGKINTEYGENKGDVQGEFKQKGNPYILKKFPNIDLIKSVTIVE
jgi:cyclophilin family peptidyl-prolyl cis-trans isomerase